MARACLASYLVSFTASPAARAPAYDLAVGDPLFCGEVSISAAAEKAALFHTVLPHGS